MSKAVQHHSSTEQLRAFAHAFEILAPNGEFGVWPLFANSRACWYPDRACGAGRLPLGSVQVIKKVNRIRTLWSDEI